MYELKAYRGVMLHDNEECWKFLRGVDLSLYNWHEEFNEFWSKHSKIPKICALMGCFWPKYIMLELKNYRESKPCGTNDWCNILRKTQFHKWNEEFGKFSQAENRYFILENKMAELNPCKK